MEFILSLTLKSSAQVWVSLQHNWPYLTASVVIATLLKLYVDTDKVSSFLNRYRGAGVVTATAVAVATPFCSCGTTAVILGMMASQTPWAPIVAFMVASPLTSPEGLVYSAGLFGWPFAWAFYIASIVLGLTGGWIAAVLESRGWLANQGRFAEAKPTPCGCSANKGASSPARVSQLQAPSLQLSVVGATCGCAGAALSSPSAGSGYLQAQPALERQQVNIGCDCGSSHPAKGDDSSALKKLVAIGERVRLPAFAQEAYSNGKRLLVMFLGFAFVGYFLNGLIPASWVAALFGNGNLYSVPLAATLGLPLYLNSEASFPLIRALLDAGMSQGAALAFMISGAGTSIGAITGALIIARWRVVGLVIGVLWAGAILCGFVFNLALALRIF